MTLRKNKLKNETNASNGVSLLTPFSAPRERQRVIWPGVWMIMGRVTLYLCKFTLFRNFTVRTRSYAEFASTIWKLCSRLARSWNCVGTCTWDGEESKKMLLYSALNPRNLDVELLTLNTNLNTLNTTNQACMQSSSLSAQQWVRNRAGYGTVLCAKFAIPCAK